LHDSSLKIVDVLPEAYYVGAHILGAINLPLEQLADRARELLPDFNAEIAVYCGQFT
jgi:rhodanese-related sulfurtransferase